MRNALTYSHKPQLNHKSVPDYTLTATDELLKPVLKSKLQHLHSRLMWVIFKWISLVEPFRMTEDHKNDHH